MTSSTSVTFSLEHVLKHSNPGQKLDVFEYRAQSHLKLCVLECVKEYNGHSLEMDKGNISETNLII